MCGLATHPTMAGKYIEIQLNNKRIVLGPASINAFSLDAIRRRIQSDFGGLYPTVLQGNFTINYKNGDGLFVRIKRQECLQAALEGLRGERILLIVDIPFQSHSQRQSALENNAYQDEWSRCWRSADRELATMENFLVKIQNEFKNFQKKRTDTAMTLLSLETTQSDMDSSLSYLEKEADDLESKIVDLEFKQCIMTAGLGDIDSILKKTNPQWDFSTDTPRFRPQNSTNSTSTTSNLINSNLPPVDRSQQQPHGAYYGHPQHQQQQQQQTLTANININFPAPAQATCSAPQYPTPNVVNYNVINNGHVITMTNYNNGQQQQQQQLITVPSTVINSGNNVQANPVQLGNGQQQQLYTVQAPLPVTNFSTPQYSAVPANYTEQPATQSGQQHQQQMPSIGNPGQSSSAPVYYYSYSYDQQQQVQITPASVQNRSEQENTAQMQPLASASEGNPDT